MFQHTRFKLSARWVPMSATVALIATSVLSLGYFGLANAPGAECDGRSIPADEIKRLEREFAVPPLHHSTKPLKLAELEFSTDVMKDYASDDVSLDAIVKDRKKYAFRAAVLDAAAKLREKWTPAAGATQLRESMRSPITDLLKRDVKREQEFWAVSIVELEIELDALKAVEKMRKDQPKRWQANYDLVVALVKSRLAYMNEYNKVLGHVITDSLPLLDPKLSQDGYILVTSKTMVSGIDVKTLAKEAQAHFKDITENYKGTPWASIAKHELDAPTGLVWKPASLKKSE